MKQTLNVAFFSLCLCIHWVQAVQIKENYVSSSVQRRQSSSSLVPANNRTDMIVHDINNVNFVMLLSNQKELPVFYEILKPTLELAVIDASTKYPNLNFHLALVRDTNACGDNILGALAAEKFYLSKVNVFIGPVCTFALDAVARMASYWNVPLFTAGGVGVEFANKKTFSTLTRMSFAMGNALGESIHHGS